MNPYSTHLPVLKEYAKGNAVEFGMGDYSTPLLLEKCDTLVSIEMQSRDWYNKIHEEYKNEPMWKSVFMPGAYDFLRVRLPDNLHFALVDGHVKSRWACVNYMMQLRVPVIVAHDTEDPRYKWDLIDDTGYIRKDFVGVQPWTTVWVKK